MKPLRSKKKSPSACTACLVEVLKKTPSAAWIGGLIWGRRAPTNRYAELIANLCQRHRGSYSESMRTYDAAEPEPNRKDLN